MNEKNTKIAFYGGNGFIGTHCAEQLSLADADVVCLSRSGRKPPHLKQQNWSQNVRWCKGDAANADPELLTSFDVVICAVGSPPIPTLSKQAYQHQLFANGTSCVNAITAAEEAGVNRIILIGAQIPWILRFKSFAYFMGKQLALNATQSFTQSSEQHSAVVLQPGMVTGKRVLNNGKNIRLDWLTAPFSPVMPWQFVSVERVAARVCDAALNMDSYPDRYTVIQNREI